MKTILLGSHHGDEIVDLPDGKCLFEIETKEGKRQVYLVCPTKSATAVPIGPPYKQKKSRRVSVEAGHDSRTFSHSYDGPLKIYVNDLCVFDG